MELANHHRLRKLMAECLPHAMHYIFRDAAGAQLVSRLDPPVIEVLLGKVAACSEEDRWG